jgi:NAD+-dependent farnesol dehydrogenase
MSSQVHPGKQFCTESEKSKVLADRIALQAAAEGVSIAIVYPGVMYGPGMLTIGDLVSRVVFFLENMPGHICFIKKKKTVHTKA